MSSPDLLPLGVATRTWFVISLQTFGGPAGQIAVMQHHLVDRKRWVGQERFLHALSYCMLLPGPEAQQLATYLGWLLNGWRGGLIAGGLFVLPGVVAMLALSVIYVGYGDTDVVSGLFAGLAPAVIAIVVSAVARVGRRALRTPGLVAIALLSFAALFFLSMPFPVVVLVAGVAGLFVSRPQRAPAAVSDVAEPLIPDDALHRELPGQRRNLRVLGIGLLLWVAPVVLAATLFSRQSVIVDEGLFFGGTALISFGGAYAVLAFVAQQAVHSYHWLTAGEMVRGLALAETTPGPLIMVVQFVAFIAAYRSPGDLDPWVAAFAGALLTTWVTFVPCFVFIFLGAPYVERLRHNERLSAALRGITAAVVGVIASLAVYFAIHTLFSGVRRVTAGPLGLEVPEPVSWQPSAFVLTALALLLIFGLRWSPCGRSWSAPPPGSLSPCCDAGCQGPSGSVRVGQGSAGRPLCVLAARYAGSRRRSTHA